MERLINELKDELKEFRKEYREDMSKWRQLLYGNGNGWGLIAQVKILWTVFGICLFVLLGIRLI